MNGPNQNIKTQIYYCIKIQLEICFFSKANKKETLIYLREQYTQIFFFVFTGTN